jgi:hypothetical protein
VVKFDHFKIGIVYLSDNSLASYQSYKNTGRQFSKAMAGLPLYFSPGRQKVETGRFQPISCI